MVRAQELATIRSTYKDAETVTRLDGKPAIAIEVKKRTGANLVETVDAVKAVADAFAKRLPEGAVVSFSQDKSTSIRQLLGDLQNHVMIAVILVFIVILYSLSAPRLAADRAGDPDLLPARHPHAGAWPGFTINIVVLFSLILAVGMLVDDAIIVTEFAERRMSEGMDKQGRLRAGRQAHGRAGHRRHHDARRRLLAAAVLAGHRRRVHEVPADHADRHAVGASMLYALVFTPTLGLDLRQGAS